MTTEPEPVDDSYPSSWRPSYIRERDEALEPLAVETWLASLPPRELQLLLAKIETMR
jgi:hypothetical protein